MSSTGSTLPITKRQRDVLTLMAEGFNREEIAHKLYIDPKTVRCHLNDMYKRLGVNRCGNPGWRAVAVFVADERITNIVLKHRVALTQGASYQVN